MTSLPALALDYALFPLLAALPVFVAWLLQARGVPNFFVTPLVVGPVAALAVLLERVRPEWPRPAQREIPLMVEAAHFICNFELGYGAALGVMALLERGLRACSPALWPSSWPIALQLVLAVLLYEGSSYWQHRWLHRHAAAWPFHVLHHSGGYLEFIRAARFHCVDFFTAAFMAYLPLTVLGTPDGVVTLLAVFVSALGIAQHANIRQRTPRWLDWIVCTPAVHRRHHSRSWRESDCNFGNTVMCWDHLFGSYGAPSAEQPAMGLEDDPLPAGFWAQMTAPFRSRRRGLTP